MPLDDMDMARLRAEMLRRAEQSMYDDGASQLGQDPNMLRVGLFGRGPKPTAPINPSRRSLFGLPEAPVAQPIVPVTPQQPAPTAPQPAVTPTAPQPVVAPTQPANPLGQLAQQALNAPVSRRQVLKRAGAAAVQSALPMPSTTDIVKEVVSPLSSSTSLFPAGLASILRNTLIDADSTKGDPLFDVEHYLKHVDPNKISPARLETIARDLANFSSDAPDQFDRFMQLREYPAELINALNDKTLLQQLLGAHAGASPYQLAESLYFNGMKKNDVLSFFKQHYKKRYSEKKLQQQLSALEEE